MICCFSYFVFKCRSILTYCIDIFGSNNFKWPSTPISSMPRPPRKIFRQASVVSRCDFYFSRNSNRHILCRFFMASFFLPIDFYIPCSDFDRTKTQYVPRHVSMRDLQSIAFCNRPCIMHLKGEYPGYFVNTASFCVTSLRFPTHATTMPN